MNHRITLIILSVVFESKIICARQKQGHSTIVTIYSPYKPGDVVGDFKLDHKLDYLGMTKYYSGEDIFGTCNKLPTLSFQDEYFYPTYDSKVATMDNIRVDNTTNCVKNGQFYLNEKIFVGGHGELWRARRIKDQNILGKDEFYVLKRMYLTDRDHILRCALREVYFGNLLRYNPLFTQLVSHFKIDDNYWLIFRDEGISLQQLLYALSTSRNLAILEPSKIWKRLRTTEIGYNTFKSIMYKIITGVEYLHSHGILHRDIKPSNILLSTNTFLMKSTDKTVNDTSNQFDSRTGTTYLLIADFSSAVSVPAIELGLYGEDGPGINESSREYTPPEVIYSHKVDEETGEYKQIPYDAEFPLAYDVWSIGVLMLEMVLGTPNVFSTDQRTSAMINHRLRKYDDGAKERALLLASFADYCIYSKTEDVLVKNERDLRTFNDISGDSDRVISKKTISPLSIMSQDLHPMVKLQERICGTDDLRKAILRRDPLGIGFNDKCGLDLLFRMLKWLPSERITLKDALNHGYFVGPYVSVITGKRVEFCTKFEKLEYEEDFLNTHNSVYESDLVGEGERERLRLKFMGDGKEISYEENNLIEENGPEIKVQTEQLIQKLTSAYDYDYSSEQSSLNRDCNGNTFMSESLQYLEDPLKKLLGSGNTMRYHFSDAWTSSNNWCDIGQCCERNEEDILFGDANDKDISSDDNVFVKSKETRNNENSALASLLDYPKNSDENLEDNLMSLDELKSSSSESLQINDHHSIVYECPKCHRQFIGNWRACDTHVTSRRHGRKCVYKSAESNKDASLPSCLSDHAMLPVDPQSGWCDIQGRRKVMEDAHAIVFSNDYKYWGVFDGHFGNRAAIFAVKYLQQFYNDYLALANAPSYNETIFYHSRSLPSALEEECTNKERNASNNWLCRSVVMQQDMASEILHPIAENEHSQELGGSTDAFISVNVALQALHLAFVDTHKRFVEFYASQPNEKSGTTATVVLLYHSHIVVGNIGDSRAVLCCNLSRLSGLSTKAMMKSEAIALTRDHTPYLRDERDRILRHGGFVEDYGVLRVNGILAVTRSIGDKSFNSDIVISEPDLLVLRRYSLESDVDQFDVSDDSDMQRESTTYSTIIESFVRSELNYSHPINACFYLHQIKELHCKESERMECARQADYHFLILGSDGLWDVMSNDQAATFTCEVLMHNIVQNYVSLTEQIESSQNISFHSLLAPDIYHSASKLLAQEAYVRGSTDNIGICIIDLTVA